MTTNYYPPPVEESTLLKIKRAVWLNRFLGISFPLDLFKYVVNLIGCDRDFLEKFVLKNSLPVNCEEMFLKKFLAEDSKLVAEYVKNFGCHLFNQTILGKNGDKEVFNALLCHYSSADKLNRDAIAYFVKRQDTDFLKQFVFQLKEVLDSKVINALLEHQDTELIKNLISVLKSMKQHLTYEQERFVIEAENKKMFDILIEEMPLTSSTLEYLIKENNAEVLQKYFQKHWLSEGISQELLAQQGSKKLLATYVTRYPLCDAALIQLVKRDYRDILKLHYLKHELSERVLMYILGLDYFKKYANIDKA